MDPDALVPLQGTRSPAGGSPVLTLMTWNVKHLGRKLFDPRQATPILTEADVVAFQEVNVGADGWKALESMAQQMRVLIGEKVCVAVSVVPSEEKKERYAYLWKNSRVAYVKADGQIMNDCPDSALTVRLGVRNAERIRREPAFGTFFFKPTAKPFVFASVHLVPENKKPAQEVRPLFETFAKVDWPLVVAGDFNLGSSHQAFDDVRAMQFKAALPAGQKTSLKRNSRELSKEYDNLWYRHLELLEPARVINLYEVFPEKEQKEIYNNFSDHCPVMARFKLK